MQLTLSTLRPGRNSKKRKKRIGRGNASGHGTYSTRGQKGQRARSGGSRGLLRRGLKELLRKKPKIGGFRSLQPKLIPVNLSDLEALFQSGEVVDAKKMRELGLIEALKPGVKVLGQGAITKKLTVVAHSFSASAKAAIEKAGGTAQVAVREPKKKAKKA